MIGKIPARVDCEVLPADPPKEPLKFRIRQYNGFEIYDASTLKPIPVTESLKPGRKIVFTDDSESAGIEVQSNGSNPFVDRGQTRYVLEKCNDDRECWVCGCVMNMRAFMPRTKETLFK
jgi:hypothetical protein